MENVSVKVFERELPLSQLDKLPKEVGIYLVGGALRDTMLGIKYRELDILVTSIPLAELTKFLRYNGKAEPVGKSFTVIKWYPKNKVGPIDVSIPSMRAFNSDQRTSEDSLDPSMKIEVDLGQRDFTVNALALDLRNGKLIDPFNGAKDIENFVLRMVSDSTFVADPLRCIRAAYICGRCGLNIEERTLKQLKSSAASISTIAPERIAEELRKILLLPKPSVALRLCKDWGLLQYFIPELGVCVDVSQEGGWHAHDVFEHLLAAVDFSPSILPVRLAALFHDIGKPARRKYLPERDRAIFYGHQNLGEKMTRRIMARLMFSKDLTERVAKLVRFHMFTQAQTDKGIRRFVRNVGIDLLDDLFALRYADIEAQGTDRDKTSDEYYQRQIDKILSEKPPLSVKDLEINGEDVMRVLNINQGPTVGKILDDFLELVIDDPSMNERELLLAKLRQIDTYSKSGTDR